MAATLGSLVAELGLNIAKMQQDMGRATSTMERGFNTMASAAAKVQRALGAIGIALSAGAIVSSIKSTIDRMDALKESADRAGVSVERLSELEFAGSLSGVELDQIEASLVRLSKAIAAAADGSKEQAKAFESLGIQVKNADGSLRRVDEVFLDVGDALSRMQDQTRRTATELTLFGRSGAQLEGLFKDGAAGIERAAEQLRKLGGVISTEAAVAADRFNEDLEKLSRSAGSLGIALTSRLLDPLTHIADKMAEAAAQGGLLSGVFQGLKTTAALAIGIDSTQQQRVQELTEALAILDEQLASGSFDPSDRFALAPDFPLPRGALDAIRRNRDEVKTELDGLLAEIEAAQQKMAAPSGVDPEALFRRQQEGVDHFLGLLEEETAAIKGQQALDKAAAADAKSAAEARLRAAEQLRSAQDQAIVGAERQLVALRALADTGEDLTELERVRFEIQQGQFAAFDAASKAILSARAEEHDQLQALIEADKQRKESAEELLQIQQQAADAVRGEALWVIESTRTPDERFAAESARLLDLVEAGEISSETMTRALEQIESQASSAQSAMQQLGATFSSAAEDALVEWEGFGKFFEGLEKDILRIITRTLVLEPIFKRLGDALSGGAGGGGPLDKVFGFLFGGARAMGGPVQAGHAYLVGERGPELFMPGASGMIAANDAGGGVSVSLVINGVRDGGDLRASAQQVVAAAGQAAQRALARNT